MTLPDSIHTATPEAPDDEMDVLYDVIRKAVDALMAHRRAEGRELESFFRVRIEAIGELWPK